jgi:uncharacterized protein YjgD (DUF1641 family)
MAQPIAFHAPAKPAPTNLEQLRDAPAEHAEAILSGYELLQLLHDRGVLNLLRGLVGGGDAVIGTIAAAVDTPESIRAIRNFLLLTKFFAGIPPDVLNSLADTVDAGAKREKAHKAPGLSTCSGGSATRTAGTPYRLPSTFLRAWEKGYDTGNGSFSHRQSGRADRAPI